MLRRLGYACLCLSLEGTSPRGTRLANATPERLRALIAANLAGLSRVLAFNAEHGIRLFRISSDVIPLGSHPANGISWWDEYADTLTDIGALVRQHDLRVSMHPGQYTVLSSPDPRVREAAEADLTYHARFLDALGLDARHKVVVHVGGAYGDRSAALGRWCASVERLPDVVRLRLVLENDERLFGVADVLAASERSGVPVVLDVLHHRVQAGSGADACLPELLRRAASTWRPDHDGVPKIHYSTQAAGRRPGAHAEYVDPEEFGAFAQLVPADVEIDCMLEAKGKDLALFELRRVLWSWL